MRWRSAAHEFQLASSSSVVDPTLSVWTWKIHIPIAVLKGHKSAITQFQWIMRRRKSTQASSELSDLSHQPLSNAAGSNETAILSVRLIIRCAFSLAYAARPIKEAATCAIAVSPQGGFAAYTDPIPMSRQHDRELNPLGPTQAMHRVEGRRPRGPGSDKDSDPLRVRSMPALLFVRASVSAIHVCTPHHNHTFGIDFDSFSSYARRYRCVVNSEQLPASGKAMSVAEVCDYNSKVAEEDANYVLRPEIMALLMQSLEMSMDLRKQVQREKERRGCAYRIWIPKITRKMPWS